MISLIRTACFISCSLGAGMFSQQVVSKVFMAEGDASPVLAAEAESWSTAEAYYCQGCFRQVAYAAPTPDEPRAAEIAVTEETPPPRVEDHAPVVPEEEQPEPIVAVPAPPQLEPAVIESVDTDIVEQTEKPVPPPEPTEQPIVVSDPIVPVTPATPTPDRKLAAGQIDVLPLPLREDAAEGTPQFGRFADDPVALPRSRSQGTSSTEDQGFAQQGPYGVPSGHSMRYVDPMELVRKRAVERAENRRMRIEARKWLGYDPLRPPVNAVPYTTGDGVRPAFVIVPFVVRDERQETRRE